MAVVVKELIVKATIENQIDEPGVIPQHIREELVQEAIEQVMGMLHVNEDGIR